MESILKDLEMLGGVRCGCVVLDGEVVASTFPEEMIASLATAGKIFSQICTGMESIDRDLNEILLEFPDTYLIGYPIGPDLFISLLAEKETNFSLVRVTVQSAARKVKKMEAAGLIPDPIRPKATAPSDSSPAVGANEDAPKEDAAVGQGTGGDLPVEAASAGATSADEGAGPPASGAPHENGQPVEDLEPVLRAMLDLLMENIGPAAKLVFNHAVEEWKDSHTPCRANLDELAKLLIVDLSTEGERKTFLQKAGELINHGDPDIRFS